MIYTEPFATQLVQQALHAQGLYDGAIDGEAGPKTRSAFLLYIQRNTKYSAANYAQYEDDLSAGQKTDIAFFRSSWIRNQSRYETVADGVSIPAKLIAAIHWREAGGDFTTYLHNGDPLGRRMVNEPKIATVFTQWEPAAVDALDTNGRDATARDALGITRDTTDLNVLCEFAERYNGLGYRRRGVPSPYVLAGTTGYTTGKFTSDGIYNPDRVDRQLGVLSMLRAV